ncbi:CLUMA_CG008050, isoform A [Clunio marinus]|uniref:CLUMA_CG008050, isoform A n=1 Tax=Clunio marinus TaxID=568069 RepID=A0A1J1I4M9_9DIPT|nr:CLUMA_CG008050, isoform A [Clunio marinus]
MYLRQNYLSSTARAVLNVTLNPTKAITDNQDKTLNVIHVIEVNQNDGIDKFASSAVSALNDCVAFPYYLV